MLTAETRQMGEQWEVVEAKLHVPLYSTQRNNQHQEDAKRPVGGCRRPLLHFTTRLLPGPT